MKRIIILILLFFIACSTEKSENEINQQAMKLNDKAMEIYSQVMFKPLQESKEDLNNALTLLNRAIILDNNYELAYINKSNILIKLERYKEASQVLNTISSFKENSAEVTSMQGFLYEKRNLADSAHQKYLSAIKAYERRIEDEPDNIENRANRAFMLLFIQDSNYMALEEITKLIDQYPENQLLQNMEQTIRYFDRETYINDF